MSFSELFIVAIVALIVLGPERLPQVARQAGRLFQKIQNFSQSLHVAMDEQLKQATLEDNIAKAKEVDTYYDVSKDPTTSNHND